jgi:2-polyprenyl-3-methyl-5-hydroxy-6-metoxy-1,4-benzoquinol methylase
MEPLSSARLPAYELFRAACESGLSVVRPLAEAAHARDAFGWNFGCAWPPSYEAYGRMRALATLEQALSLQPKRVLEVAAGDASLSACLAEKGAFVWANDLREDALIEALKTFASRDRIRLLLGNCLELDPSQTGRFDLVTGCEIIEHVAHPVDFLRHLKRFLAPGGHILLTTPNGSYFRNRLPTYAEIEDLKSLEARQFRPDADGHLFLMTPAELCDVAAQAGLRVQEIALCATPFLTGHCKFSLLRSEPVVPVCYLLEKLCQRLPAALRQRLCFSISAILT